MTNEKTASEILAQSVKENAGKLKSKSPVGNKMALKASVIGTGAGGGNLASLMTPYSYKTVSFNTAEVDMIGQNVTAKILIKDTDGSGNDRTFSGNKFKSSYNAFFNHEEVKDLIDESQLIFVCGTGGGGSGTILSVMIGSYLRREYPNKIIINIGILGSIKETRTRQENMRDFITDLENTKSQYILFDNNSAKGLQGQAIYDKVNDDAVRAMRLITKEYFQDTTRGNMDGRDYARLLSMPGLMSVLPIDNLGLSVTDENIDLLKRIETESENNTVIITKKPDAYGFFANLSPEIYSSIDMDFHREQVKYGMPNSGFAGSHLQDATGVGPQFAMIQTGCEAPLERFAMIERRIEELKNTDEKVALPTVNKNKETLTFAGDGGSETGKGSSVFDDLF